MGCIYRIVNIVNGHVYIGSASKSIKKRWADHVRELRRNEHHSRYLQRAWNKYGEESFRIEEIERGISPERLLEREQHYLDDRKNNFPPKSNYNVCWVAGNCRGRKATPESRLKMSASHKGIRRSAESIAKQSSTWIDRYARPCVVKDPVGVVHNISNLRSFARQHDLCHAALRSVVIGRTNLHRGWSRPDYQPVVYIVTSPTGEEMVLETDLKTFSISRGLNYKCMHKVLRGLAKTHRGWTVKTVGNARKRKGR